MSLVQLRISGPQPSGGPVSDVRPHGGPLVDRQARQVQYLRISLTDRCNYRCTYCMPDQPLQYGPRTEVLTLEEIARLCREFARWGVRRVRLTGGEPTLRRGVVELVATLSRIRTVQGDPLEVVLTTNGETLADLAQPLHDAGLRGLTVSLDSLDPDRFRAITRRGHLDRVRLGLEAANAAGFSPIKINTVAVRGFNDDELGSIARFAWSHGMVPRFIELMPMASGSLFVPGELMPAADVRREVARVAGGECVSDSGRGIAGTGPAAYWKIIGGDFEGHRFGTIAAMTENFCSSCNRLRISATGRLHACLARDETGDLRAALRAADPSQLETTVRAVLGAKRDAHGFNMDGTGGPAKAMISIGG